MKRANLIALVVGVVVGVTATQTVRRFHRQAIFKPTPLVAPSFTATFNPEFRALIQRLRVSGESEADLANLVVAEFGRQLHLQPRSKEIWMDSFEQNHTRALDAGREAAVKELLGATAFAAWRKQAVLRCLHLRLLGLDLRQADRLYECWHAWDAANLWPYWKTHPLPADADSAVHFVGVWRQQARLLMAHDAQLRSLLSREQFVQYVREHRREAAWEFWEFEDKENPLTMRQHEALYSARMRYLTRWIEIAHRERIALTPGGHPDMQREGEKYSTIRKRILSQP